jgi:hypothetical protein
MAMAMIFFFLFLAEGYASQIPADEPPAGLSKDLMPTV